MGDANMAYFVPEAEDGPLIEAPLLLAPPPAVKPGESYFQPEPDDDEAGPASPPPGVMLVGRTGGRRRSRDCVKCVVVGDDRVGKTSLLATYGTHRFPDEHIPTVFETFEVNHQGEGARPWRMRLHDTARQEDYDSERVMTYAGADVVLIVFAIISPSSLENIRQRWLPEIRHHAGQVPVFVVGTMSDLRQDGHIRNKLACRNSKPVTMSEGQKLCRKIHAQGYFECSALAEPEELDSLFDNVFKAAINYKLQKRKLQAKPQNPLLLLKHMFNLKMHKPGLVRRDS